MVANYNKINCCLSLRLFCEGKYGFLLVAIILTSLFSTSVFAQERQVSFDNVGVQVDPGGSATTITLSNYNTPAGDDRLLVVTVAVGDGSNFVTGMTYGGIPLIEETYVLTGESTSEIWYLVNPPVGNANLVVNFDSNFSPGSRGGVVGAMSFSNVNQSDPIGYSSPITVQAGVGNTSNFTFPVTATGNMVVSAIASNNTNPISPASGQDSRWQNNYGSSAKRGAGFTNSINPAGQTDNFTFAGSPNWAVSRIALNGSPCPVITADILVTNISCSGGSDGQIEILDVAGGSGGTFEYRLNGGAWQSNNEFINLGPGSYEVFIRNTDEPDCFQSHGIFNISDPDILDADVTVNPGTCFGADDGSITVSNPTGGNGTFQVSINGGPWNSVSTGSPHTFMNLAADDYNVLIRDADFTSCIEDLGTFTVEEPDVLNALGSITDVSCFGFDDGTITVSNPIGGGGNYEVSINGSDWETVSPGTPFTFVNLEPDNYTVMLRDADEVTCEVILGAITITEPIELTGTADVVQAGCIAGGSIDVTPSGGTDPYTYNWADLSGMDNPQDRFGLQPGTYTVTVTDANGCFWESGNITINEPTDCEGEYVCREGSSTLTVDPIPGANGYVWTLPESADPLSGTILETSPTVIVRTTLPTIEIDWENVIPGEYEVCVEPENDCGPGTEVCREIFVNEVTLNLIPQDVNCKGEDDGRIFSQVLTGVGPYTYAWSNGSTDANPTGLGPGFYTVTVTDSQGCTAEATVEIEEPEDELEVTVVLVTDEDPFGAENGAIEISVSGGTATYIFEWTKLNDPFFMETTQNIFNLSSGLYQVVVTDENGCQVILNISVDGVGAPLDVVGIPTDVLCVGEATGSIDLFPTGGETPYTFEWAASNGGVVPTGQENSQNLTGLVAGTYTVTVSDAAPLGSAPIISFDINEPSAALSLDLDPTDITCFGSNDGAISTDVSGGTAPYFFSWNTGSSAENLINLSPGTYEVTVTDANGCTATASETINQPDEIEISGDVANSSCNPGMGGSIDLTVIGGEPGYTYLWSNSETTQDITDLAPGVYSVTVTDENGCTATASFTVRNVCLDVAKSLLTGPTNNEDGTYSLTFQIQLQNTGNTTVFDLELTDDLEAVFGSDFSNVVISSSKFDLDPGYTGESPNTELLVAGQSLVPGEIGLVNISLDVEPGVLANPYTNAVTANGEDADGLETEATDEQDVNFMEDPIIGVAKALVGTPVNNGDGSFDLSFLFTVRNFGDVPLNNVQVVEDLEATFGTGSIIVVNSIQSSAGFSENIDFNGTTDADLLDAGNSLAVNQIETIELNITVTPTGTSSTFENQVTATGTSSGGTLVSDTSTDGTSPDPNDDSPTEIELPENPEIGLAKRLVGSPVNNNDGTYTIVYEFRVRNTGDVNLSNIQITDDLTETFPSPASFSGFNASSSTLTPNTSFDGDTDQNLLEGTDELLVGEVKTLSLEFVVTPAANLGPYENSAEALGLSVGGVIITDISHDGTSVDPDGTGPGNHDDPTPVEFNENPVIGLAKAVTDITNNQDGTYDVTFEILVQNYGDVPLENIQVTDELTSTFGAPATFDLISVSASGSLTENTDFDGDGDQNLLIAASSSLAFGASENITLVVEVTPGSNLGPYFNSAVGTAEGPGGTPTEDTSTNGLNPDPDGDGDPTNNDTPTPVNFTENTSVSVSKELDGPISEDGDEYTFTYSIEIENTGDAPLLGIQVVDELAIAFADAASVTVNSTTITQQPLSGALILNPAFDGDSDTEILDGEGTLFPGETATIELEITVVAIAMTHPGGPYLNEAVVLGFSPGGVFVLGVDDDEVFLFENPEIVLTKTVDNIIDNRDGTFRVTFRLELESIGDVPVFELELYDDIVTQFSGLNPRDFLAEEGLSLLTNPDWDGTASSNILEPGQFFDEEIEDDYFVFISFTVDEPAPLPQTINNLATVEGEGPLGTQVDDSDDADAEFNTFDADLFITKTADNMSPTSGEEITFTVTAGNNGPENATGIQVEDLLPSGYTHINSTVSTGSYNEITGIWVIGDLPSGETETLSINVKVNQTGIYLNTATIEVGNENDPDLTNNTDEVLPDVCRAGLIAPTLIKN